LPAHVFTMDNLSDEDEDTNTTTTNKNNNNNISNADSSNVIRKGLNRRSSIC